MHTRYKIFIIAGEMSGDQIGGLILKEFSKKNNYNLYGVGGNNLKKNGLRSIFSMDKISLMGLIEIIPKIPILLSLISFTVNKIIKVDPDILITIDSPDFNFRVLQKIKKVKPKLKTVHIVAPTVWAWKSNRAKKISKFVDNLFVLFPFEKKYFVPYKIKTFFIGHPLIEGLISNKYLNNSDKKYFNNLKKTISVFPGSRKKEILNHLNIILEALVSYKNKLNVLILATNKNYELIQNISKKFKNKLTFKIVKNKNKNKNKYKVFNESYAAIAVSGTITLELALMKVPLFAVYKLNRISYIILKLMVYSKFITLVNIIYDKLIVEELIQNDFNITNIKKNINDLLENKKRYNLQKKYFSKLPLKLKHKRMLPSKISSKLIANILNK